MSMISVMEVLLWLFAEARVRFTLPPGESATGGDLRMGPVKAGRVPQLESRAAGPGRRGGPIMNRLTKSLLGAAGLGAALSLGVAIGAASADQPRMHEALDALRSARASLVDATADKGGHRVKALRYIDAAISEVQEGIRFDRRR
jgi:hypothetical protein